MARVQTKGAVDERFHIYNRGVDKRNTFLDREDYLRFYESLFYFNIEEPTTNLSFARLQSYRNVNKLVDIEAYCLLPNHFHLLLKQKTENGICEFMRRLCGGYTSYFNEKNERSGALFQGVYKRVLIKDDAQFRYLLSYINENHAVHNVSLTKDVMYSSTWHYQKVFKSKVLPAPSSLLNYDAPKAKALAKDIYKKRLEYKQDILEGK